MPGTSAKGRVLIIDDEPGVRDLLSETLSGIGGYETVIATDGFDGIEKIRASEFDVIFTDLAMPRLNGMDFLKKCKDIDVKTPIVVLTGVSSMEIAVNAMRQGAYDFITKPFHLDKIVSTTEKIIGERKLFRRLASSQGSEASLETLNAELFKKLQQIVALHSIITDVDACRENKEIFERAAGMAAKLLTVNEVSFGIVREGLLEIKSSIGVVGKAFPVAGTLLSRVIDRKQHHVADVGEASPYDGAAMPSQFLAIPLVVGNEVFGILSFSGKADGTAFSEEEVYLAIDFVKKVASRIENNALYEVFFNNLVDTLKSLIATIEARDFYTKQHSERVTMYALQVAEAMHLGPDEIDTIRFGGYLHDIGKIGVRDTVLLKPGHLSVEEMEEIRLHAVIGDEIVKPMKFFEKEREIIRHHHEHFNGSGYPDSACGREISVIARILAVADSYDAMTSNRPYRQARTREFAIGELQRCAGTQFDPEVVRVFLETPMGGEIFT
ncbi:MAG: HD domain-containing phosphohydrolase [bacterium]|jgi:putative nucleotidyltransferase with HDIG domain